jgi:mitochondrial fission protein ELM1
MATPKTWFGTLKPLEGIAPSVNTLAEASSDVPPTTFCMKKPTHTKRKSLFAKTLKEHMCGRIFASKYNMDSGVVRV